MASAFTSNFDFLSNRLINKVDIIANEKTISAIAQWDTGATGTAISYSVVKQLGLIPTGMLPIKTPSGNMNVNTYLIDLLLPNKVLINDVKVFDSKIGDQGIDLLIGMDIINKGDFAVTSYGGKTTFSFVMPSQKMIDFAKMLNVQNMIGTHGKGKRKKK